MRISDWSSDVCSSDLERDPRKKLDQTGRAARQPLEDAAKPIMDGAGHGQTLARRMFGQRQEEGEVLLRHALFIKGEDVASTRGVDQIVGVLEDGRSVG